MRKLFLLMLLMCCALFVRAAYFQNIPRVLVQPDGDTLRCFATGDEFYHYLHDADGYTIVLDSHTGYYVYAIEENGRPVPSSFIAGRVSPAEVGLVPNVRISANEWRQRRAARLAPLAEHPVSPLRSDNQGHINNLIIFIHFADGDDFSQTASEINLMFNDSTTAETNSMYNFFKEVSYDQLHITSHLYPQPVDNVIQYYQDSHPRSYYMPYSETNPDGYSTEEGSDEATVREMALLTNAVNYVSSMIPTDLDLDFNGDGQVDNICFLVQGDVGDWSDLLWPHRWCLYTNEVYIHDKRVWDFNLVLSENTWYFTNSTLCHEMSHTLGAPDLYHYSDENGYVPVGDWDVMGQDLNPPQHMGAYMKYRYCGWISWIQTIVHSGTYKLQKLSSTGDEPYAYFIPTEEEDQFFLVECREKNDHWESALPNRGMLIYRIDKRFSGNAGWNGEDVFDEIYVYRKNGTLTSNGDLTKAVFRNGVNTSFDYSTNPKPFLSNGYVSAVRIYDVHFYGDSATFSYLAPGDTIGIEELTYGNLRIFPNPATDQVTISLPEGVAPVAQATLYDLAGRRVKELGLLEDATFSVHALKPGVYVVKVRLMDGYIYEKKVIVK